MLTEAGLDHPMFKDKVWLHQPCWSRNFHFRLVPISTLLATVVKPRRGIWSGCGLQVRSARHSIVRAVFWPGGLSMLFAGASWACVGKPDLARSDTRLRMRQRLSEFDPRPERPLPCGRSLSWDISLAIAALHSNAPLEIHTARYRRRLDRPKASSPDSWCQGQPTPHPGEGTRPANVIITCGWRFMTYEEAVLCAFAAERIGTTCAATPMGEREEPPASRRPPRRHRKLRRVSGAGSRMRADGLHGVNHDNWVETMSCFNRRHVKPNKRPRGVDVWDLASCKQMVEVDIEVEPGKETLSSGPRCGVAQSRRPRLCQ
ncbi:uncharacterized protein B0T15DRAFT_323202 [Chaetomium strumarium]|uniref:Uncharacterized protein n=1 Tax=Chaetomium strumarium TaxID=1170767 RepID=A0AAJ0GKT6_9PEZI|nr:hypothetical protein B0T15DRAFT_323202 [Chaetomium strumarium]